MGTNQMPQMENSTSNLVQGLHSKCILTKILHKIAFCKEPAFHHYNEILEASC